MIHLMQPSLGENEMKAISEVFADNWPGKGPRIEQFETEFSRYIGCDGSEMTGINCCTEGLFQVIEALNLTPRDEVILPTISFIGTAHAVKHSRARIKLVDVDFRSLNPRPEDIKNAITPRTRAVLLLHYGGYPGWISEIEEITRGTSILLIEDAACSLGASLNGISCGMFGDVGLWSFDSMKLLVTGDGGMVRIAKPELRERFRLSISMGGSQRGFNEASEKNKSWWKVDPFLAGRRAYMNDLNAAIGLVQLGRIVSFINRRKEIAGMYNQGFEDIPNILVPPRQNEKVDFFYWIQVPHKLRDKLAIFLLENGVYTTFRYWPLHQTKLYACSEKFPQADEATKKTLHLPMHQNLSNTEVEYIIDKVKFYIVNH